MTKDDKNGIKSVVCLFILYNISEIFRVDYLVTKNKNYLLFKKKTIKNWMELLLYYCCFNNNYNYIL